MPIQYFAQNRLTGDGTTTVWPFSFAGENPGVGDGTETYLEESDVAVALVDYDSFGVESRTVVAHTLTGPAQVTVTPAIALDQEFVIYRTTPLEVPVADFTDFASISEHDLDQSFRQSLFVTQEMVDLTNDTREFSLQALTAAGQAVLTTDGFQADVEQLTSDVNALLAGGEVSGLMFKADNLSGLSNLDTARANLGVYGTSVVDQAQADADAALAVLASIQADASSLPVTTSSGTQPVSDSINDRNRVIGSIAELRAAPTAGVSAGAGVRTRGYYAGSDIGGNQFHWNATSTSADNGVTVIKADDAATGRWIADDSRRILVTQAGARGDGVTPDTSAIQAAIDASRVGGTLEFPAPAANYRVTGTVNYNKRLLVVGGGKVDIALEGAHTAFNLLSAGIIVDGFSVTGDRTSLQTAFRLGADWITIVNCGVFLLDRGFEVWGGVWHRIAGIRGRNIKSTVLEVGNVVGTVVEDFRYDTDVGTYAQPTYGINLYGEGCNFTDLDLIHAGTCVYLNTNSTRESIWNFFNSCSFDTSTYGLRASNSNASYTVRGAMFDHCWFSSHSEQGVFLDINNNGNGFTFSDCHIINNQKGGIVTALNTKNVRVIGGEFAGNSMAAPGTYAHIKHGANGSLKVVGASFGNWGDLGNVSRAAIERVSGAGFLFVNGCDSDATYNNTGLIDAVSTSVARRVGTNAGNLPSGDGWIAATLQNGWGQFGSGHQAARFRRTVDGTVFVEGLISGGTITPGTVLFNLPVGYRPAAKLRIAQVDSNGVMGFDVEPNGNVTTQSFNTNTWASITCSFQAT